MDLDKLNNMFKTETTFRDIMGKKIQIYDIICFLPRKRDNHYDNRSLKIGIVKKIDKVKKKNFIRCFSINKNDRTVYSISDEYSEYNVMIVNETFSKEELNSFRDMIFEKDQKNKKEKEDNTTTYILLAFEHKTKKDKFGFYILFNQGKKNKEILFAKIDELQERYKDYNIYPYMKYDNNIEGFAVSSIKDVKYTKIRKFSNTYDIGLNGELINCFIEVKKHGTELNYKYSKENYRSIKDIGGDLFKYYFDHDSGRDEYLNIIEDWYNGKSCIFNDYYRSNMPLNKDNHITLFKRFLNK